MLPLKVCPLPLPVCPLPLPESASGAVEAVASGSVEAIASDAVEAFASDASGAAPSAGNSIAFREKPSSETISHFSFSASRTQLFVRFQMTELLLVRSAV